MIEVKFLCVCIVLSNRNITDDKEGVFPKFMTLYKPVLLHISQNTESLSVANFTQVESPFTRAC